jgi:hypothetical protein
MDRFIAAVESSVRAASPLESSTPSGCWLSALIEMQLVSIAKRRDESHNTPNKDTLTLLSVLHSSLESDRRSIMRIQERIVDLRRSDYAPAFSRFEELIEEILSEKTQLEETLENLFRTTSIQDSRNAISCESPTPEFLEQESEDANETFSHSHYPGFHLRSVQSGFVYIRHERAADQRQRPQYLFFRIYFDCSIDRLRTQLLLSARYETYFVEVVVICCIEIIGGRDFLSKPSIRSTVCTTSVTKRYIQSNALQ